MFNSRMTQNQGFLEWILNNELFFFYLTASYFTLLLLWFAILYKLKQFIELRFGHAMDFYDLEDPVNSSEFSAIVIDPVCREEKLHEIPVAVVVEEDKDGKLGDVCAICLEEFVKGDEVKVLPHCEHVYHQSCIDTWLCSYSVRCPMCRDKTLDVPVPATRYSSSVPLN